MGAVEPRDLCELASELGASSTALRDAVQTLANAYIDEGERDPAQVAPRILPELREARSRLDAVIAELEGGGPDSSAKPTTL